MIFLNSLVHARTRSMGRQLGERATEGGREGGVGRAPFSHTFSAGGRGHEGVRLGRKIRPTLTSTRKNILLTSFDTSVQSCSQSYIRLGSAPSAASSNRLPPRIKSQRLEKCGDQSNGLAPSACLPMQPAISEEVNSSQRFPSYPSPSRYRDD